MAGVYPLHSRSVVPVVFLQGAQGRSTKPGRQLLLLLLLLVKTV